MEIWYEFGYDDVRYSWILNGWNVNRIITRAPGGFEPFPGTVQQRLAERLFGISWSKGTPALPPELPAFDFGNLFGDAHVSVTAPVS